MYARDLTSSPRPFAPGGNGIKLMVIGVSVIQRFGLMPPSMKTRANRVQVSAHQIAAGCGNLDTQRETK